MRNTPPELPVEQLSDVHLIEALCLALREIGTKDYGLPDNDYAVAAIFKVREVYTQVAKRGLEVAAQLSELSKQTKWQMQFLLSDCLAYPVVIPYVRESDGLRRVLRCPLCGQHELPDRQGISLCSPCLVITAEALANRIPLQGLLFMRMFSKSYWCKHADEETVLASFANEYEPLSEIWCQQCILEEQERRTEK